MLPKAIRTMKQDAKKSLAGMKKVIKMLECNIASERADRICFASAFFQILHHHMEFGDLRPEQISLATLLRGDDPIVK
jgi:hypothetical protein